MSTASGPKDKWQKRYMTYLDNISIRDNIHVNFFVIFTVFQSFAWKCTVYMASDLNI